MSKINSQDESARAHVERAFERKVRRSRWALLFERMWPRLWLLIGIATLFAVMSVFGIWAHLDDVVHYAIPHLREAKGSPLLRDRELIRPLLGLCQVTPSYFAKLRVI